MTGSKALTCRISRPVKGRILLDRDQIKEIFELASRIYEQNVNQASPVEKRSVETVGRPVISIQLSDGSDYESDSSNLLDQVNTGKSRVIKSLSIKTIYGILSISLSLDPSDVLYRGAIIRIEGPEDQARHIATEIERILTQNRDITTLAYKIPSVAYGLLLSIIILWQSINNFITHAPDQDHSKYILARIGTSASILLGATAISSVPFGIFKNHYLSNVGFLWGEDLNRHKLTKSICQFFAIAVPAGIIGNYIYGHF